MSVNQRSEKLAAKAEELETELSKWLHAERLLVAGERIRVTIAVESIPTAIVRIAPRSPGKGRKLPQLSDKLSREEWGIILGQSWNVTARTALERLRVNGNTSLSGVSAVEQQDINRKFRKLKLSFRLQVVERRIGVRGRTVKLWKVGEKIAAS